MWKGSGKSESTLHSSQSAAQENPTDPPRVALEGHEWVWFPEGYWAERPLPHGLRVPSRPVREWWRHVNELQRQQPVNGENMKPEALVTIEDEQSTPIPVSNNEEIPVPAQPSSKGTNCQSRLTSTRTKKIFQKINYLSPLYPRFTSPTGELEGLYCKTKRDLGNTLGRQRKLAKREPSGPKDSPSQTTLIIEGAARYLSQPYAEETGRRAKMLSGIFRRNSLESKGSRQEFWQARRRTGGSQDSGISATSSIREVLMARTPLATPDSETQYTGTNGQKYTRADISDPNGSTFLPSEARRINTPPTSTNSLAGHPRGFFFDFSPPVKDDESHTTYKEDSQVDSQSPEAFQRSSRSLKSQDWWTAGAQNSLGSGKGYNSFELEVPEHLPSSPLCPMHSKNSSGGWGTCAIHSKRKLSQEGSDGTDENDSFT